MSTTKSLMLMAALVCASTGFATGEGAPVGEATRSLFNLASLPGPFLAGTEGDTSGSGDAPAATPAKGPPLPIHNVEGVGGMAITPMAYLVNPGAKGTQIGLPSFSFTHVHAGSKTVQTFAITQTFLRRFELPFRTILRGDCAGHKKAAGGSPPLLSALSFATTTSWPVPIVGCRGVAGPACRGVGFGGERAAGRLALKDR